MKIKKKINSAEAKKSNFCHCNFLIIESKIALINKKWVQKIKLVKDKFLRNKTKR